MRFKRVVDVVQVLVLVAAAVTVLALFLNDGSSPTAAPSEDGTVDGAAVYEANCASCHGPDGGGGLGPPLGDGTVVEVFPDPADQVVVITDGRDGMPAFGDRLSPEEIDAVTTYTRDEL
jgi:mono/diheme cytochrome c family protein